MLDSETTFLLADGSIIERRRSMACLTTWGVGGIPDLIISPKSDRCFFEITKIVQEDKPMLSVIGGGSNTLLADNLKGHVFVNTRDLNGMEVTESADSIFFQCQAGVQLRTIFLYAVRHNLSGLEFAVGIPGTVAGALLGNVGAQGCSLSDILEWVEVLDLRSGELSRLSRAQISWKYRYSSLSTTKTCFLITRCGLRLYKEKRETILTKVAFFADKKKQQPLNKRTAGCVFKNPENDSAGRLLELSGCKGMMVGGALVSPTHANFIENMGGAISADIYSLSQEMKKRVWDRFGVFLEYEVKFIGEFSAVS